VPICRKNVAPTSGKKKNAGTVLIAKKVIRESPNARRTRIHQSSAADATSRTAPRRASGAAPRTARVSMRRVTGRQIRTVRPANRKAIGSDR
jgi:hypothetical protein